MATPELVELTDGIVSATVRPSWGAGIGRFDQVAGGRREPLFRPEPAGGPRHPFELASQVLVPWSNRISGGGFSFRGRRYDLAPNLEGEPFPIHGNGFAIAWQLLELSRNAATLALPSDGPGPFRYHAVLSYGVAGGILTMSLAVENTGDESLPFGLGFHPWIVRTAGTRLRARANAVWLEDERHLPRGSSPTRIPGEWDFSRPSGLPEGWINNVFTGWDGLAEVSWEDRGLGLRIGACPKLSNFILYSPSNEAPFFCFEPVSHPVDAFNLPGDPASHGLIALEPGETTEVTATFEAIGLPQ
jgi:aldose 1-epimerase